MSRVPAVWGNVPPRNKNFTGRQEILEKLREGASAGHRFRRVLPQAVQGMGGVGKTAIASSTRIGTGPNTTSSGGFPPTSCLGARVARGTGRPAGSAAGDAPRD